MLFIVINLYLRRFFFCNKLMNNYCLLRKILHKAKLLFNKILHNTLYFAAGSLQKNHAERLFAFANFERAFEVIMSSYSVILI